jgi:hypothetical protein
MPTPLPTDADVDLVPPDRQEVETVIGGVLAAVAPVGGPTALQRDLFAALSHSMTGHDVDTATVALVPAEELAAALARRNAQFRLRIAQLMLLGELVLSTVPEVVCRRVDHTINELSISPDFLTAGRASSKESLGYALIDFGRNGYSEHWSSDHFPLHTSGALASAWENACDDPDLAQRWEQLGELPPGTLGRMVRSFYRNRGFSVPGSPGSAPPLLSQHDWVHVLADYGATVDNELEVFGLIARSSPDPTGFALLAMVLGLFETGAIDRAAGDFFQADTGHLSRTGMTVRLADAFRRGANCGHDLMAIDWFDYADQPVEEVRSALGIGPKGSEALATGSSTPWEPAGITEFQLRQGREYAEHHGITYTPFDPA